MSDRYGIPKIGSKQEDGAHSNTSSSKASSTIEISYFSTSYMGDNNSQVVEHSPYTIWQSQMQKVM